jgi:hypothetical protein
MSNTLKSAALGALKALARAFADPQYMGAFGPLWWPPSVKVTGQRQRSGRRR